MSVLRGVDFPSRLSLLTSLQQTGSEKSVVLNRGHGPEVHAQIVCVHHAAEELCVQKAIALAITRRKRVSPSGEKYLSPN
ncbi:MAG: hypothetical protein ACRCYK_07130, partial [Aeromonas hydrophila]